MARKKASKEKARIDLILDLDNEAKRLVACPIENQNPVDFARLALRYWHAGMPNRGRQLMREAREIQHRISVPKAVIIDSVSEPTLAGGTNENTLPVCQNPGIPVALGARSIPVATPNHSNLYVPSGADPA